MIKKLFRLLGKSKKNAKANIAKPSLIIDDFEIGAESIVCNYEPFKMFQLW